jgi:ABC-type Fe3+/spermidine/putrescine transport system ATPase subunit
MMPIAVKIDQVSRQFDGVKALRNVSLDIAAGEFFTLLGSSGSGKSTLLKLIGGFDSPDGGRILFDGIDVTKVSADRRPVNTVFQDLALFPHMSVSQNVGYGLRVLRRGNDEITRRVHEALSLVDLSGFEDRNVNLLSGGQRQRVALARALVMEPGLLLLDEPLTGLDERLREQMRDEFGRLHRRTGATFILVTHNHDEALTLSDRMAVMHQGSIEQVDRPAAFFEAPVNTFVARFVGIEALLHAQHIDPNSGKATVSGQVIPVTGKNVEGAQVALRTDRISMSKPSDTAANLRVSVVGVLFRGLHCDLRVCLDDQQQFVLRVPTDTAKHLTPGDQLHLWIRPGGAILVAAHENPALKRESVPYPATL